MTNILRYKIGRLVILALQSKDVDVWEAARDIPVKVDGSCCILLDDDVYECECGLGSMGECDLC